MRKEYFINRHQLLKTTFLLRRKKIIIGIALFFSIILISLAVARLTKIKTITVVGTPARVEIDSDILPYNLLFFPAEKIRQKLLIEYPQFSDITFRKEYPNTLEIILVSREPAAIIEAQDRRVFVDEYGTIIGDTENDQKPIIEMPDLQIKGTKVDHPAVNTSLAFLAGMAQYDDIKRIIVEDGTLRVQTSDMIFIMAEKRDGSESARTLQSLLTGFRIRGTMPKIIDLRFDQPVVTW